MQKGNNPNGPCVTEQRTVCYLHVAADDALKVYALEQSIPAYANIAGCSCCACIQMQCATFATTRHANMTVLRSNGVGSSGNCQLTHHTWGTASTTAGVLLN